LSCWAHRAWGNLNQHTPPLSRTLPPEHTGAPAPTVTVVDPRHPLCGRTLPLVGITTKQYLGRCCVVWLRPWVERHIPVTATDLEFDPNTLSPLPLSLAALQDLLRMFAQVTQVGAAGRGEGSHEWATDAASPSGVRSQRAATDRPTPGVGDADPSPTATGALPAGRDVSGVSAPAPTVSAAESGTVRRGGQP
jgi:hypothetical protein